jgi:hypothetical protein
MAGRLAVLLKKINPDLQEGIGNVNDILVTNNYGKAQKHIEDIRQKQDKVKKFTVYNYALNNTNLAPEDYYKTDKGFELNEGYETSKAYQDYVKAIDENNKTTGNIKAPDPTEFKSFVTQKPEYYEELYKNGQLKQNKVPLTTDELKLKMYEKAGIKPEDIGWFSEMSNTFDPNAENRRLNELIINKTPQLTSIYGKLGDKYAQLFAREVSQYLNQPQNFENPLSKSKPSEWELTENNGKYYWTTDIFDPKKQEWTKKITRIETDKKIIDEWDRKHSAKPKDIADYTAKELRDMDFDKLISTFNPESELKPHFDDFSPEIQNKLYEMFPKWKEEDDFQAQLDNKKLNGTRNKRKRSSGTGKISPEKANILSAIQTASKIGMGNKGVDWTKWKIKDKKPYTKAMDYLRNATGLEDKDIWDMIGNYEKTGKMDWDKLNTNDEEIDSEEIDDITPQDEIDWFDDKFDNASGTTKKTLYYRHFRDNAKTQKAKDYADKKYLKHIGINR